MCDPLLKTQPAFHDAIVACDRLFAACAGWSVIEEIRSGERLNETDVAQAAVFSMQAALAALWKAWGVDPDGIVGQSLGEVAAAHVAGALDLQSAVLVVHHRGRLMKQLAGRGKTAVVGLPPEAVRGLIAGWSGRIFLAGNSSPETSVVSGDSAAIRAWLDEVERQGVFAREMAGIDVAFHTPHMEPLRGELVASLGEIDCADPRVDLMSSVTGAWLNGKRSDAAYWGRNLCEPFQLAHALDEMAAAGFDGFLEISPHSMLAGPIREALKQRNARALVLGSGRRGDSSGSAIFKSLAEIYKAGRNPNWRAVFPDGGRCVTLPAYPFLRDRYWLDQISAGPTTDEATGASPLLGRVVECATPVGQRLWEQDVSAQSPYYLAGHRILGSVMFPAAGYVDAAIAAMRHLRPSATAVEIAGLRFHEALPLSESLYRLQTVFSPVAEGTYQFQFNARRNVGDGWTRHASGRAVAVRASAAPRDLDALRRGLTEDISGSAHYEAMAGQGTRIRRQLPRDSADLARRRSSDIRACPG